MLELRLFGTPRAHYFGRLLAALLKRHRGTRGILFWAVGEGEKE